MTKDVDGFEKTRYSGAFTIDGVIHHVDATQAIDRGITVQLDRIPSVPQSHQNRTGTAHSVLLMKAHSQRAPPSADPRHFCPVIS